MSDVLECQECSCVLEKDDRPVCAICCDNKIDIASDASFAEGKKEARLENLKTIRQGDLIDLAKGIRDGDKDRANAALNVIAEELGWSEVIAKGRAAQ